VQQQLLAFDRHKAGPLQSSVSTAQQKQKPASTAAAGGAQVAAAGLPGLDQLLQHVVSSTTAAAVAGDESQTAAAGAAHRPPGWLTTEQLQLLWQELLQLLFAADQPSTAAGQAVQPAQDAPNHHQQQQQEEVLTEHTSFLNLALHDLTLTPDDIIQHGDESSMSEDSWDDAEEEGWDEVQQQDEQQQQQDSQQQALPGRLLAAAVDPLYFVSAKGCRKAALAAVRAYAEVSYSYCYSCRDKVSPCICIHLCRKRAGRTHSCAVGLCGGGGALWHCFTCKTLPYATHFVCNVSAWRMRTLMQT
jgi:hypothetical protein